MSNELGVPVSKITNTWTKYNCSGKQRRTYKINEHFFTEIDTEAKAYFLGLFASDGCVYDNNIKNKQNIVRIVLHKQDEYILQTLKKYLDTDKPLYYARGKYVSFEIVSDIMFNDFIKYNIKPRKTYDNAIVILDDLMMRHFIRGYFDGDGTIGRKATGLHNQSVSISGYSCNTNKIKRHLEKINIFSSFVSDKRKVPIDNSEFGSLCFVNKTEKYCFLKYIYENATIYLERKYNLSMKFIADIDKEERPSHKEIITYYNYAVRKVC